MTQTAKAVVLLIEDDPNHSALLAEAFDTSRGDMKVVVADSIAAAREYLETAVPAIILCDYLLPDGTGLEILKYHLQDRCLRVPFVLLTGQGNELIAVDAMKAGASDYIVKSQKSLFSLPDVCRVLIREHALRLEKE